MKKNNNDEIIKLIIFSILFITLLFQSFLETVILPLKYLDEVLPVLIIMLLVLKFIKNKELIKVYTKKEIIMYLKLFFPLVGVFLLGLIGNFVYDYQPISAIIYDIIVVFKGFFTFIGFKMLLFGEKRISYIPLFNKIIQIISMVLFTLIIMNLIIPIFPGGDSRWGFPAQRLFFPHPTYLATTSIVLIALLALFSKNSDKNKYFIILLSIVICCTQRYKAIMFLGVFYLLYYFIIEKNNRINLKITILLFFVAIIVGGQKIIEYIMNPWYARSALMLNSFNIAIDHFPLGSGFGTFATWSSGVYYSPLYEMYNLNEIYGITRDYFQFLGDSFWPAILGQFGFIGVGLLLFILFQIFKCIEANDNKYIYCSQLSIFIYLLILSTSETSYMSPVGPLLCLVMALDIQE